MTNKTYPFPNFSSWQILATLDKSSNLNTIQASMQRVYEQRKVKHATCKNVKGRVLEDSNAIGDTDVFVVVPIGGAIVHPR